MAKGSSRQSLQLWHSYQASKQAVHLNRSKQAKQCTERISIQVPTTKETLPGLAKGKKDISSEGCQSWRLA